MPVASNRIYVGAALVIAMITIAATVSAVWPGPAHTAPTIAAQDTPQEPARFGPGVISAAQPEPATSANNAAAADPWVPAGLKTTPDQHLAVDKDLRLVFDYFLQPAYPGDRTERLNKLQRYLQAQLPASAYPEASTIATNYAKYLAALDAADAKEKFPSQKGMMPSSDAEAERMKASLTELSRLRQNLLGVQLAQLWFADEEAGLRHYLDHRGKMPHMSELSNR